MSGCPCSEPESKYGSTNQPLARMSTRIGWRWHRKLIFPTSQLILIFASPVLGNHSLNNHKCYTTFSAYDHLEFIQGAPQILCLLEQYIIRWPLSLSQVKSSSEKFRNEINWKNGNDKMGKKFFVTRFVLFLMTSSD